MPTHDDAPPREADPDEDPPHQTWVRIHPEDRLWLDDEITRLRRERYRETKRLVQTSIQDTLRDVINELRTARARIPQLEAHIEHLEEDLERLHDRCHRYQRMLTTPDPDAPNAHQPPPPSPADTLPPANGDAPLD